MRAVLESTARGSSRRCGEAQESLLPRLFLRIVMFLCESPADADGGLGETDCLGQGGAFLEALHESVPPLRPYLPGIGVSARPKHPH